MLEELSKIEVIARKQSVEFVDRLSKEGHNPALLSAMAVGVLLGSCSATTRQMLGIEGLNGWLTLVFQTAQQIAADPKDPDATIQFAYQIKEGGPPASPSS